MNVNDFVEQLTRATYPKLTKVQVRRLLDAFVRTVRDLPVGEELVLSGFGAFRKVRTGPRVVYAPPTGAFGREAQAYRIPPMEVLKFRAFPSTKRKLNDSASK